MNTNNQQFLSARSGGGRPGRAGFCGFVLGLFLLGGAALPAWATTSGGGGSGGGPGPGGGTTFGSGGGGGGGDETVGTLPVTLSGSGLEFRRQGTVTQPALFVEGNYFQIVDSVLAARGHGIVLVQSLDPVTGWSRLVFLGEAQVTFDRQMLALAPVRLGMAIPRQADATLQWGNRSSSSSAVGLIDLPIVALLASGTLEHTPFQAFAGSGRTGTRIWANATPDVLVLTQSH